MEWLVLAAFVLAAAALIGLPLRGAGGPTQLDMSVEALREERERLLAELRELDADAASGRASAQDRAAGRRALAPRLRVVTDALRDADGAPQR
jgi:hypothetical protein